MKRQNTRDVIFVFVKVGVLEPDLDDVVTIFEEKFGDGVTRKRTCDTRNSLNTTKMSKGKRFHLLEEAYLHEKSTHQQNSLFL